MKRTFDFTASLLGLILLLPIFTGIAIAIALDSPGGVFFRQVRVGQYGKDFRLWKFRTMRPDSEKKGLLTVGGRDNRVTRVGYWLRKYKLDELPQLINVLVGEMSLVGPRPEVRKYVDLYTPEQKKVLDVKPGITDYASIEYADENDLLARAEDPETVYITRIMPDKIRLNMNYIKDPGIGTDLKIIWLTVSKILGRRGPTAGR